MGIIDGLVYDEDSGAPLSTQPYHTDALFPTVTSPMTAALGATKASSATLGALLATGITVRCLKTACMHAQQWVLKETWRGDTPVRLSA